MIWHKSWHIWFISSTKRGRCSWERCDRWPAAMYNLRPTPMPEWSCIPSPPLGDFLGSPMALWIPRSSCSWIVMIICNDQWAIINYLWTLLVNHQPTVGFSRCGYWVRQISEVIGDSDLDCFFIMSKVLWHAACGFWKWQYSRLISFSGLFLVDEAQHHLMKHPRSIVPPPQKSGIYFFCFKVYGVTFSVVNLYTWMGGLLCRHRDWMLSRCASTRKIIIMVLTTGVGSPFLIGMSLPLSVNIPHPYWEHLPHVRTQVHAKFGP